MPRWHRSDTSAKTAEVLEAIRVMRSDIVAATRTIKIGGPVDEARGRLFTAADDLVTAVTGEPPNHALSHVAPRPPAADREPD